MEGAEEYTHASDMQRKEALDVVEEFSDDIAKMHGRCIDIGCGPGTVTNDLLLPRLPPDAVVVGADNLKSMIDHARECYKDEDRLSFIQLDIENDKLPNKEIGQYDNVFSSCCLNWCQNMSQAYKNIYALLKPGGQGLLFFMPFHDAYDVWINMANNPRYAAYLKKNASQYVTPLRNSPNPRMTLKKILEEVGFEVLHCSYREKFHSHASIQCFENSMMAVNPYVKKLPDYLKDKYREEKMKQLMDLKILFKKYSSDTPDEFGVLDKYRLLIAHIKKPNNRN